MVSDSRHAPLRIERLASARDVSAPSEPQPLSAWRGTGAYVLLADPGGGKTTSFKMEANAPGALYLRARQFIEAPAPPPAWRGVTLFLDGIDELMAGATAKDEPLAALRRRLHELGSPRFRLACREADWNAVVDVGTWHALSPDGRFAELRLEPLRDEDILRLLREGDPRVPDPEAFWRQAEAQQVTELLRNPQVLTLMVRASDGRGQLPQTRQQTYADACKALAVEHDPTIHRLVRGKAPGAEVVLREAGLLCAVLLLSNRDAWTFATASQALASDLCVDELLEALGVRHVEAVLASKLFTAEGDRRWPVHRTVAECLAAQVLADRVDNQGYPLTRLMALMQGHDGGIVDALRGLHAWLATLLSFARRTLLLAKDPLGVLLYGDVSEWPAADKRSLLQNLQQVAKQTPWFRHREWASHPFGALATRDMLSYFEQVLRGVGRARGDQVFVDCVLDALIHARAGFPELLPHLANWVRDEQCSGDLRASAAEAWLVHAGTDRAEARRWLDDIHQGRLADPQERVTGVLLAGLYPADLPVQEVMAYFRPGRSGSYRYQVFWRDQLLRKTPAALHPVLADTLPAGLAAAARLAIDIDVTVVVAQVVAAALRVAGEQSPIERVHAWLRAGLDEHGSSVLEDTSGDGVRAWLAEHPQVQKDVVAFAWRHLKPDLQTHRRYFWEADALRHGATRPQDWYRWLLEQAERSEDEELVAYLFSEAAGAAMAPAAGFSIQLEDIEAFVERVRNKWPQVQGWLQGITSLPLDAWQAKNHQRAIKTRTEHDANRRKRHEDWAQYLPRLSAGTAPAQLMHYIASVYRGPFSDIRGDTPEQRVLDLLGGDSRTFQAAVEGLQAVLWRTDLPTVEKILKNDKAQHGAYYLQTACLLGASLASEHDPGVVESWPDDLSQRLVAFHLRDGSGKVPDWFNQLAVSRPELVAAVYVPFAKQRMARRAESSITGLWTMAREDRWRALAQRALPPLLAATPTRCNASQLRRLNGELLPAALRHLSAAELLEIAARRLAVKSLDAGQRIAWLATAITLGDAAAMPTLVRYIGSSETKAAHLEAALAYLPLDRWPVDGLAGLVELMAPHAIAEYRGTEGQVTEVTAADRRRDTVRGLIMRLADDPSEAAAAALARLAQVPALRRWHSTATYAADQQLRVARAARYVPPSPGAAMATLARLAPANVADLQALVLEHLQDLQAELGGDTTALQLFWRDAWAGSRVENECRDRLLDRLRDPLSRLSVELAKEHAHAFDKRSDLAAIAHVDGKRLLLPIEIKKEDHEKLWTACADQLDRFYTTEPAAREHAQGYGIYLVLWFDEKPRSRPPEDTRPGSAKELQAWLTERVPAVDRARLRVFVLDLSVPEGVRDKVAKVREAAKALKAS